MPLEAAESKRCRNKHILIAAVLQQARQGRRGTRRDDGCSRAGTADHVGKGAHAPELELLSAPELELLTAMLTALLTALQALQQQRDASASNSFLCAALPLVGEASQEVGHLLLHHFAAAVAQQLQQARHTTGLCHGSHVAVAVQHQAPQSQRGRHQDAIIAAGVQQAGHL